MNLKNIRFKFMIVSLLGFGNAMNRWLSLAISSVLSIVFRPKGVKIRFDHWLISFFNFFYFFIIVYFGNCIQIARTFYSQYIKVILSPV